MKISWIEVGWKLLLVVELVFGVSGFCILALAVWWGSWILSLYAGLLLGSILLIDWFVNV